MYLQLLLDHHKLLQQQKAAFLSHEHALHVLNRSAEQKAAFLSHEHASACAGQYKKLLGILQLLIGSLVCEILIDPLPVVN